MHYGTDELRKRWCLNHLAEKKREFRNRGAAHANSLVLIVLSCYICYIHGFAIHTGCVLIAWNLPQEDFELTTCPRTMTVFLLYIATILNFLEYNN